MAGERACWQVVLMGDAAHSMSPTLGQACNCGLEDAKIFAGKHPLSVLSSGFQAEDSMKVKCPVLRVGSCRFPIGDVLACRLSRGPWQPCRWTCMCKSTLQARSKNWLAGILEASMGNVDAALKQYNAERLPDVLALVNLNQMWSARIGMRTEVSSCMSILSRPMSWVRLKAA